MGAHDRAAPARPRVAHGAAAGRSGAWKQGRSRIVRARDGGPGPQAGPEVSGVCPGGRPEAAQADSEVSTHYRLCVRTWFDELSCCRTVVGTTLAILYGIEMQEEGDPIVDAVCASMENFSTSFMPGAVSADWLPLPQSLCRLT